MFYFDLNRTHFKQIFYRYWSFRQHSTIPFSLLIYSKCYYIVLFNFYYYHEIDVAENLHKYDYCVCGKLLAVHTFQYHCYRSCTISTLLLTYLTKFAEA